MGFILSARTDLVEKIKASLLACFLFSGWGAGIRTPVMSESESDALPLGDTPIFSTLPLYHIFLGLSIDLKIFLENFALFAKIGCLILHIIFFIDVRL